jgi:DNA-binding MarR family transcriptional regulator
MAEQILNATDPSITPDSPRTLAKRWKHEELFDQGFVAVPTLFLRHYAHLTPHRLTLGEAMFVLHLMEFKWDSEAPFPGYGTLAKRMNISDKMARRHAQSLEAKKYLKRQIRIGMTNRFDLSPLFDALLRATRAEREAMQGRSKKTESSEQQIAWLKRMFDAYSNLTASDQTELKNWKSADKDRAISDWPGWESLVGKIPKQ